MPDKTPNPGIEQLAAIGRVALEGGELLVRGASKLALALGISPLVVGLTVVAFGTSSPEMAVSVQGAMSGSTDIAIGNVVSGPTRNRLAAQVSTGTAGSTTCWKTRRSRALPSFDTASTVHSIGPV